MISAPDKSAAIAQCSANILAVLRWYKLPDVQVVAAQTDRIMAIAPQVFAEELGHRQAFDTWRFNRNHGTTATTGWRENVATCSLQIVEHSTGMLEIDIDYFNPNFGAGVALWHGFEIVANKLWKRKTDPFKIKARLLKRGIEV